MSLKYYGELSNKNVGAATFFGQYDHCSCKTTFGFGWHPVELIPTSKIKKQWFLRVCSGLLLKPVRNSSSVEKAATATTDLSLTLLDITIFIWEQTHVKTLKSIEETKILAWHLQVICWIVWEYKFCLFITRFWRGWGFFLVARSFV